MNDLVQLFEEMRYPASCMREELNRLYKGWVCSVHIEKMEAEDRMETTYAFDRIDELLKMLEAYENEKHAKKAA